MSPSRVWHIFRLDAALYLRRPLCWFLIVILGLVAWGLSTGHARISSGDSSVGGTKAWITSEFAVAQTLTVAVFGFYSFFLAVGAGMTVIRDDELRIGELLHATPLGAGEYVWAKFAAVLVAFVWVLAMQLGLMAFFYHAVPSAEAAELIGPLDLANYVRPAIVFALPAIVFMAGTSFAIGTWTRRPILVFVLPVVAVLGCIFFLWDWSPSWLDPRVDRLLMLIDPAGFRWLNETWLKVDRGVEFYNHGRLELDLPFALSRLAFVLIGLASVALCQRQFARSLRGASWSGDLRAALADVAARSAAAGAAEQPVTQRRLAELATHTRPLGRLAATLEVAGAELRELRSQPGLYLFVPLILLETVMNSLFDTGAFDTPLLFTPGTLALGSANFLTLLASLLVMFYTVESLERERSTGLAPIYYATPVPSSAIVFGKAAANAVVVAFIMAATFAGCVIALAIQGKVPLDLMPFGIVWGLLLVPTFVLWTAFVMAVFAVTRNRFTTYALCLGVLMLTGYLVLRGTMNWVGNWPLWTRGSWSDMGIFELDRRALVLNRVMALGLAVLFGVVAVRLAARRDFDAVRIMHRLRPIALAKAAFRLAPLALVPLVVGALLWLDVRAGFEGAEAKKRQKDYWRKNLATWKDVPVPAITAADIDLELEPARRWFRVAGRYDLKNHRDKPIAQIPVSAGDHWSSVAWTMNDAEYSPENQAGLLVFTPPRPLAHGDELRLGFRYEGTFPKGITENGGGTGEFILPSGVVLTSFAPSFVPVVGYLESVGIDDDNRYEPRVYPADYYREQLDPFVGAGSPFRTRIRITGPEAYTLNSVGTLVSESVAAGKRTVVWESDHPVRFFNVVAGRWSVRRGAGTAIFYHPTHSYNIDEMTEALDAARRYYSEWFHPFPWQELKLSEFPALATYAQGFPTDITFSEGIGFLTRSDPRANAAFLVTAHEAAHQWWGNLLTPGKGPGGNILSEGTSHFSSILLMEQVKGLGQRIELCKRLEKQYGDRRQQDSERPLVRIDGSRDGDQTVTYDKGGWVFWMLLNHMGRERALAGMREFIRQFEDGPDYPLLEDFVATMRPFAPDAAAFDKFTRQWFFDVVVPEYRLSEARSTGGDDSDSTERLVAVRVQNVGTGRMPVDIAAARGERFDDEKQPLATYQEARTRVVLGAGESQVVEIRCRFRPDRILVDPDAVVLQLERKAAVVKL